LSAVHRKSSRIRIRPSSDPDHDPAVLAVEPGGQLGHLGGALGARQRVELDVRHGCAVYAT